MGGGGGGSGGQWEGSGWGGGVRVDVNEELKIQKKKIFFWGGGPVGGMVAEGVRWGVGLVGRGSGWMSTQCWG